MDISRELLEQVVAHALEEDPNECCGMVAVAPGGSEGAPARAMRVKRTRNVYPSPKRFEIDGKEALRALNEFEDAGWELGAIYHSHTHTAPYPSQTDINFAAHWPGVEWIIVGLSESRPPEVRSYLIEGGDVREVALEALPA